MMKEDQNTRDNLFSEEAEHLAAIGMLLEEALKKAKEDVQKINKEYMDSKRYMAEYRGEIDPHEMFQNELLLKQTDRTGAISTEIRDRIARMKESPYFARIDFRENDSEEAESYYIGPFSFRHKNELLIFDWRAPVAGMFYDFEPGPAGFEAPCGRIDGELTKKRQFKIRDGVMEYALESTSNIQDDVLQRELSHTSDEKMKSIISTIQKEQNRIIRNEKAETMIIQGVAGSGKTSVALHRIAYLLYRFKNRLSAGNVAILSPNKVFGSYISNVIPELGEEPIYELSAADIAKIQLEGTAEFEREKDPLESADETWAKRVCFKSSMKFAALLNEYIRRMPDEIFQPEDISCGRLNAGKEWIWQRYQALEKYPVRRRLAMIADDIYDRFEAENIMDEELPGMAFIRKSLAAMLTVKTPLALYKDFYVKNGVIEMFRMPAGKTLEWEDVYPFLYVLHAYEGLKQSKITKLLVIDEMQDYTPVQYMVFNLIFPCPKTILGDFGQIISPNHRCTLDDIKRIYQGAEFVQLNKSYRSTFEIITFADRIQNAVTLEAVKRHGEKPQIIACTDETDEIHRMKEAISTFETGGNVSLGIILKTDREAKVMYAILSKEYSVNLITPKSTEFRNGVTVTSIRMAKGLEFDEVMIPHADSLTYATEYDRSLLYIACTRAMHKLTILYSGILTTLIDRRR
ncbi:ATP-binding domain-containing protein [Clostridium sp. AM58-1XD]|uniref:HelD family protein n=1 Tax=Clostridium sp. AM58-1XD TaxID=2292307 RepID=UPI0026CED750